jgi:multiple sugar transport system permease protein
MSTMSTRQAQRRLAMWLCAPAVLLMASVSLYPIAYAVYLSFQRSDLRFSNDAQFVGLANYAAVLGSPYWWTALHNTVLISAVSVAVELVLGMALALLMHRAIVGRGIVRTAVLIPYAFVTVVAGYGWQYAWTPGTGYLAALLPQGSAPLTQHWSAMLVIIGAEVWKTTPFMALLLLAGLAFVPDELLRAAKVDGASSWQRFWHVTILCMKPAILVALLFRTLDAFRVFDHVYILTQGGAGTGTLSILGYNNLFVALNLGIGSTISVLMFVLAAFIAFVFVRLFGASAPGAAPGGGA